MIKLGYTLDYCMGTMSVLNVRDTGTTFHEGRSKNIGNNYRHFREIYVVGGPTPYLYFFNSLTYPLKQNFPVKIIKKLIHNI